MSDQKANVTLEKFFPQIANEETFQKWITAKQTAYLIHNCEMNQYKRAEGRGQNRASLDTDKYSVLIVISPVNGAASIQIKNKTIITNGIAAQQEQEKNEVRAKLEQLKSDYNEIENDTIATEKQRELVLKILAREIAALESRV